MSNLWVIDRDAVSGFDDPAWLDDVWHVAIKKFGGMRLEEYMKRADDKPSCDEILEAVERYF